MKKAERLLFLLSASLCVVKCFGLLEVPLWIILLPFIMAILLMIMSMIRVVVFVNGVKAVIELIATFMEYLCTL